ncbi:hypothetical protein D3C79_870270 [compost metagenome]
MGVPQAAVVVGFAIAVFIELRGVIEVRVRGQGQGQNTGLGFEADAAAVQAGGPDIAVDLGPGKRALGARQAAAGLAVDQLFEHQIVALLEDPGLDQVEGGFGIALGTADARVFMGPDLGGEQAEGEGQGAFHGMTPAGFMVSNRYQIA